MLKKTLLFIILSFLISKLSAQTADFVAYNGNIWTVDKANPTAEAIASYQGKFIYVGKDSGIQEYIGEGTEVMDLNGAFVVPGFYDNHVHFESTGRLLYGLNLLDVSNENLFIDPKRKLELKQNIIKTDYDHRIAMSFAVMGSKLGHDLKIMDEESIETSFPNFVENFNHSGGNLGKDIE